MVWQTARDEGTVIWSPGYGFYQRNKLILVISTERLLRNIARMIASPITASAAATASEKKTRTCPLTSLEIKLNKTVKIFTCLTINSTHIIKTKPFYYNR